VSKKLTKTIANNFPSSMELFGEFKGLIYEKRKFFSNLGTFLKVKGYYI